MKLLKLIFFTFLLFLIAYSTAFSQKEQVEIVDLDVSLDTTPKAAFDIKNEKVIQDSLLNDAFIYLDCNQQLSFQEIVNLQNTFVKYSDTVTWNPNCAYWVKITINNTLPHEYEWVLNLGKDLNFHTPPILEKSHQEFQVKFYELRMKH